MVSQGTLSKFLCQCHEVKITTVKNLYPEVAVCDSYPLRSLFQIILFIVSESLSFAETETVMRNHELMWKKA